MIQIGHLEAPAPEFVSAKIKHGARTDLTKHKRGLLRLRE